MRFGAGWPIGPCALIDLIGVDVHVHASEALYGALGEERMAPPERLLEMQREGHLGRKTGQGFFEYGASARAATRRCRPGCETAGSVIDAVKLSAPAAKTRAPDAVS